MPVIGDSVHRTDALGKVTGETQFPGDINLPGQAYMKILFARRVYARILSINISKAEAMEGVLAVLTAKDVPVNEYGLIMPDQPVLCGPGSNKSGADRVRFIGDQVALVIAESERIAEAAVQKIEVEFEDLPAITEVLASMEPNAPLIHPDRESNVFCHYRIRKGDVAEAFQNADLILEDEYVTPVQEHAYLQPEAGVGYVDSEGRITVEVAGQWTHEDQEQIAHALGLELDRIRVKYAAIGGAFGGREDMSVQIVLALAAMKLNEMGIGRPVKIIWSREESILGHHKRHKFILRNKWAASKEGKLLAAEVEVIQDGGAYAYTSTKVLGNATLMCTGPYEIPNVKVDAYSVYTNNIPGGAFRGFGGPQGAFAAESQMNKLAERLGIDPVELRLRNIVREGSLLSVGTPLPKGVSIDKVLRKCAEVAGWNETSGGWKKPVIENRREHGEIHLLRGIGIACGYKNVGFSFGAPENCWATIELHGDADIQEVVLRHAAAEVGQGTHTVLTQMAAEAVGVSIDRVRLIVSDTAETDNSGSVSASRMTFMAGNAIRGAADRALELWRNEERPAISRYQYRPPATTPFDPQTGKSEPNFAYGYVAEAAIVEVDTETGRVRLVDVICADDVGHAINPKQVQGQIEGAIVQASGYVLLEDFQQRNGEVQTDQLSTYLIPTVLDIPESVESHILEFPDPIGPWGARGMAEMPYIPLAPAVISAVQDATGIWFDDFPLIPERVLWGLKSLESE